jgi:filamentous hemagglutinin
MNRQCYRLVFNRAKGQLVAASELAVTTGKSPKESGRAGRRRALRQPALAATLAALLLGSPGVQASIASDPNAPGNQRPTVLETANGVPQVNIQTPSAAGVSRNSYRQFDVTSKGVILNNSRSNTQTQLSGWVQGNPHLTSGEARVILNEVNSRHPSQLRGYLEVAGSRAEVVIANPAGIDVNGAGFINASRATLTTGTPELRNGELTGYRVQQGTVNISGAGLDASGTDYTAILARAVEVQGGVWANELEMVAGANRIGRDGQIERLNAQGDAPDVAIDVAHLGGMYAGKIRLVATDAGVGVNNAGSIAATHAGGVGEVVLTADGRIVNRGAITAQGDIQLTSQTGIDNVDQGAILAQGDLALSASGAQGRIHSAADAILAAGVDANSLTLGDRGQLSLTASDTITTQGRQLAGGGFLAEADTVTLAGSQTQARDIAITARQGDIDASGATLSASNTLTASAAATLRTDDASVQADRLELSAANISNRDGELIQAGNDTLHLTTGKLDNRGGRVAANADIAIHADALDNAAGTVRAGGSLEVDVQEDIDNAQGRLIAENDLRLTASQLTNTQGLIGAVQGSLDVAAESLDNTQGHIEAADGLRLDVTDSLTNAAGEIVQLSDEAELQIATTNLHGRDGRIVSQGGLTLQGGEVVLDGARTQAQRIALQADSLSHRGGELIHLGTQAPLTLDVTQALDNTQGLIASNTDLMLRTGELINQEGTIQATGNSDVAAASLDNRQGELLAGDTLSVTVEGSVDNAQGQLLAQRSLNLRAASLSNTQGAIGTVAGDLTLTLADTLDNANGSLEAGDGLHIRGRELHNQGGTLLGERVTLNTAGRRLDNTAGQIAARDVLTIVSGVLDNTGGTLRSGGDVTLDTQGRSLLNRDNAESGGILANGALVLRSGQLDNSAGLIGVGALDIDAESVTNRNGTLFSRGDLTLAANDLDNRSGELLALGDTRLTLDEALRNQGGLVRALGWLDIAARRLLNGTTQGDEQGLEGRNVTIVADEIHNRQGTMRADERLDLVATNGIDNRDGLLSSQQTLAVQADDLDNRGGTLIANQRLALTLVRLPGSGRLLSLGDLILQLASDFTLGQGEELKAAGDLQLATTGTLTNRGTLQAGATLDLTADTLVNAASGELSGTTTRLSAGQLTNRGLIDGVTTRIDATTLDNLGTGRIYGDRLGIQATTLTNQREGGISPVIAARERLDLGVRNLTNRDEALIFSAGDMAIAGRLDTEGNATGQARRIDNRSATIESLGDMTIAADTLNNLNDHFETELVLVESGSTLKRYIQPRGWDEKHPASEFQLDAGGYQFSLHFAGVRHLPSGARSANWYEYVVNRELYRTKVIKSSPASIISGNDLAFLGSEFLNDNSKMISAGNLKVEVIVLDNREAVGEERYHEHGVVREGYIERYCEDAQGCDWAEVKWTEFTAYSASGSSSHVFPISIVQGNQSTSRDSVSIAPTKTAVINGSAASTGTIKSGASNVNVGQGMVEVPAIGRSGSAVQASSFGAGDVIRTLTPQLQLPNNSLFQLRPTGIRPLIETDPRFTNQRQWLSSDYLLSALHPDPAMTQKRLGDGFYEQRLIREQITQLTGQRFLAGYSDDEAQYAALMNNAATFAQQHGLRPGVALTAAQMAQLTSDIVWLVEQTVTLEDGRQVKVLVPQVYARVRDGDLRGDGTLIAGSSLDLNVAGELINSGTLAARQGVTVAADRIANLNGRIAGDEVSLTAASDLLNRGGDIDGRAVTLFAGRDLALQGGSVSAERELTLQAGRDLALTSQAGRQTTLTVTGADGLLQASAGRDLTIAGAALDSAGSLALQAERDLSIASTRDTQSTRYGRVTLSRADIGHQATLNAGQDLLLNAGRDLSLAAVDVSAEGSGLIAAGRDLSLETLTTGSALRGTPRLQRSRQQEIGTTLAIGNDLTLMAGQDLYARAANVSAEGDLDVIAGRNIEIEAGQSSRYDEQRRGRTHTIDSQSRVQGSDFAAGGHLSLTAGEDLRLTASRLQAGESAALLAGGNIELLTAQEHDYSLYESRRRSLLGGSRTQRDEVSKTRSIGSEISVGGDLLLASGQDQTYRAARLAADGDIELQSGGAIRFETASDVHSESHERSRSSFAWQSARGEGFTRETLRHSELVAQGELIIQAADGIHIDVERIDRRSVTRSIDAMVAANPDLAWLKEMEQRGDVDWQQVKAFHDSWDYSHSGLGAGAALAISIVASAWAGPAAAGLVDGAIASAMVGAGAGSLAGTGAVSLANNRGDLGAAFSDTFSSGSLRGAATAALTAGATRGMTDQVWGTQTNPTTGATNNLNLNNGSDIARFAGQRATQAAIDAGIRSAVEGGSYRNHLGDSLENAVTHVVSGVLFHAVGDLAFDKRWDEGGAQKIALHALVGGSVAEAMGGDFRTGALAAGASEALVHHLVEDGRANPVLSNTIAQLVGIVAAELSGGDVNDGAFIAGQVESYNRQLHSAERMLARDLADLSEGRFTLEEIEQAMRGMYHDGLGQEPGSNIIVDLHDLEAVDGTYFDYGGNWLATPGEDGTTRYLVQSIPKDTSPELIAYIIAQTGGENSPYRAPVYQLPAEEAAPGQPRDRLTGRPLDEEGRYTVSYVVDGKIYHVPHFSCADATCNALGANVDYSDPGAQAWNRAMNAKALDDLSRAASAGVVMTPVGAIGAGIATAGTGAGLLAGYLENDFGSALSKELLMLGFEEYAKARGLPAAEVRRLTHAFNLAGVWDDVMHNGKDMLGLSDE